MRAPISGLEEDLVGEIDHWKEQQEDVCVDEVSGVERRQGRPALYQRQEEVGSESEVCGPRVPERFEG